jgi:hypothetical protein
MVDLSLFKQFSGFSILCYVIAFYPKSILDSRHERRRYLTELVAKAACIEFDCSKNSDYVMGTQPHNYCRGTFFLDDVLTEKIQFLENNCFCYPFYDLH